MDEQAALAWNRWADARERETTFRRDKSGTPGNMALDEYMFLQGFKAGVMQEVMHRAAEETKEIRERERAAEFVGQDVMEFRMQ